jgi:membrane protease YdiL (CAAX protease family)
MVFELFLRVLFCLIRGLALSWLTLRSKSLIPATLDHGVNNVFAFSKTRVTFPGQHWIYAGSLALLA